MWIKRKASLPVGGLEENEVRENKTRLWEVSDWTIATMVAIGARESTGYAKTSFQSSEKSLFSLKTSNYQTTGRQDCTSAL